MVLTHIGVGQHVVAQLLAVAQAGAVAQHHPGVGRSTAMWSVMVLALAGPTPMLTMVMPLASSAHQVVGGHLRQAGGRCPGRRPPRGRLTRRA